MKLIINICLLLLSFTVYANDDVSIDVPKGQKSFNVTLAANATTGFEWSVVSYDKDLLQLTASHYQAPKTKLIGAGGQTVFAFNVNKGKIYPAQTVIEFKYARSWERQSAVSHKKVIVRFVD